MWKHLQKLLTIPAKFPGSNQAWSVTRTLLNSERTNVLESVQARPLHILTPFSRLQPSLLLQPWKRENNETGDLSLTSGTPNQVIPYVPSRGMKIKGKVKRRCKDCQLIWDDGILYNLCKTHPRHKQKLKPQYWENLRIITHKTGGTKRPW